MIRNNKSRLGVATAVIFMVALTGCENEGDGSVDVTMQCDVPSGGQETIKAHYSADAESVDLVIGSDASRTLKLADTENGAQYVDGDLLFWSNAPGTGFIATKDEMSYVNCQVVSEEKSKGSMF